MKRINEDAKFNKKMINQETKFRKKMINEYAKIIYRRIDEDIQLEEMNEQGKIEENIYLEQCEISKRPKKVIKGKNAKK